MKKSQCDYANEMQKYEKVCVVLRKLLHCAKCWKRSLRRSDTRECCCAKVTNWKKMKKWGCKRCAKSIIIYANGCTKLQEIAQRKRRR